MLLFARVHPGRSLLHDGVSGRGRVRPRTGDHGRAAHGDGARLQSHAGRVRNRVRREQRGRLPRRSARRRGASGCGRPRQRRSAPSTSATRSSTAMRDACAVLAAAGGAIAYLTVRNRRRSRRRRRRVCCSRATTPHSPRNLALGFARWNSGSSTVRASCRSSTATSTVASWTKLRSCKPPTASASSTRGRPSTTSSPSTRTSRPTRCSSATSRRRRTNIHLGSGIFNITPPVNHPARVAERVGAARPPVGGAVRVRDGPRFVDDRAEGLRHRRSRPHQATCSTRSSASSARCGARANTRVTTASSSRCRRATCSRSRTRSRIRRCGSRPAIPRRSRRRRAWGSACCASRSAGSKPIKPLVELYKNEIANAEPVGDYVNDNVMVTTQLLCLEDGARARRSPPTSGWGTTAACCCDTSTRSRDRRACRSGRRCSRTQPSSRSTPRSRHGEMPYGTPEEVERRDPEVRRCRRRPGGVRPAVVDDGTRPRVRDDRDVRRHVLPRFDPDPVHRTTRQREAAASRVSSRGVIGTTSRGVQ